MQQEEKAKNDANIVINSNGSNSKGCVAITLGCFGLFGGLVALLIVGVFALILTGFMTFNGMVSSITGFLGQPAIAQVTSTRTIVSGIHPLGQLVSISVEVAQADINVSISESRKSFKS